MPKRIVLCLDGTGNQPKSGKSNVRRLYDMLEESPSQVTYYDPGVGTLGDPRATNRFSNRATRFGGLAFGHGVERNVGQASQFLSDVWEPGDRIFVFGFSRGAYTARGLVGLLRTLGLLRRQLAANLTEYSLDIYAHDEPPGDATDADKEEWWAVRSDWQRSFGNPAWPSRFEWTQIHFLGLWDTVKFVGTLNLRAKWKEARWPFTLRPENVAHIRHALAIDERRRKYREYRLNQNLVKDARRDAREVWFAGVHSDVGGTFFDDKRLADISLKWMVDEATSEQLTVDPDTGSDYPDAAVRVLGIVPELYEESIGAPLGEPLPDRWVDGTVHHAGWKWWFAGPGWRTRVIEPGDEIHPSVHEKIESPGSPGYEPRIPVLANGR